MWWVYSFIQLISSIRNGYPTSWMHCVIVSSIAQTLKHGVLNLAYSVEVNGGGFRLTGLQTSVLFRSPSPFYSQVHVYELAAETVNFLIPLAWTNEVERVHGMQNI